VRSAEKRAAFACASTIAPSMRPVRRPSTISRVFDNVASSPSRDCSRSVKNVKPPETSSDRAPTAANPASIRSAPGDSRKRST
jgi:hypothetical protein